MYRILSVLIIAVILQSCQEKVPAVESSADLVEFQNKGHELVYKMAQIVGTYDQLRALQDVSYTYTYKTPDGKEDQSTEKYIFDGELSYASYQKHERTLADLPGVMEQGYDGQNFWLKNQEKYIQDEAMIKRVIFNRKTNFYWFTMMQKLLDPGLKYKFVKEDIVDGINYSVVEVSFNSDDEKPTDIYQLYINNETFLVDQFLFTVVDFNVVETPFLMKLEYEKVDGILIPTKRQYTKANWQAEAQNNDWIYVTWTDITFNNGLTKSLFESKG